jgi:2'-5' RNA ligase
MRARLAAHRDRWRWPEQATLVRADSLHLTLHFLGHVPDPRIPALKEGLGVHLEPFELTLRQAQVWGGGIAVLNTECPPGLERLHAALASRLDSVGLPMAGRHYRPHVTLAQHAAGAEPPRRFAPLCWLVRRYALAKSPGGGGYEILQRWP